MKKWFTKIWWEYLLEKPLNIKKLLCRINRHKCGPKYYTTNGIEPDWKCINCNDYIG